VFERKCSPCAVRHKSHHRDFNITRLVRGETYRYDAVFSLPALTDGVYQLQIALTDKNNPGKGAIKMPIGVPDNPSADYVIGTVTIDN
jgi:hypothetical protein